MFTFDIIADTVLPSILVCILIPAFKQMPKGLKILFWYLLFSSVIFFISNLLADRSINNLYLYHLYTPVSFIFISLFFYSLRLSVLFNSIIQIVLYPILFFLFFNTIYFEDLSVFDSNAILVTSLLTIIFSITYYILFLVKDYQEINNKMYPFWIISGFFIYSSGTFIIYYFLKYSSNFFNSVASQFWEIQNIILIIKNLFFAVGIFICIRKKQNYLGL